MSVTQTAQEKACRALLDAMTTTEKICQMLMPHFWSWRDSDGEEKPVTALRPEMAALLARHGFAGVILFAPNLRDSAGAAKLTADMQRANAAAVGRTGLIIAVDQEGGDTTRLARGTCMPGSMALGAAGDPELAYRAAAVIAEELTALGIGCDAAPDMDLNNNPANPIIGLRSFGDRPEAAAALGIRFMQGLRDNGVIGVLKHFPGHGDTDMDSHTSLPCVRKPYAQLRAGELAPFRACIDAGAEAVMTAHIQYPLIETQTCPSIVTGEPVTLPATLSKTILTDILRGDMGFDGVIMTDAMNMAGVARHFDRYDAARMAIAAGADILLMPAELADAAGIADFEQYIATLTDMTRQGLIDEKQVDAAVLRILRLKARHSLLWAADVPAPDPDRLACVGSEAHHALEWDIALRAVTLLKNDGVLPLKPDAPAVILAPEEADTEGLRWALRQLKREGKLRADADVRVQASDGLDEARLRELTAGRTVVAVSTGRPGQGAWIPGVIASAHASGHACAVICGGLPYEAARYADADALALAWLPKPMPEPPDRCSAPVREYGPNLPAALYRLFSPGTLPFGRLPVDIPGAGGEGLAWPAGYGLDAAP